MHKIAKVLGRLIVSLTIACAFGYGFYGLVTYVQPMAKQDYVQARLSVVADQTEILLNGAARSYDESILPNGKTDKKRMGETIKVLELALDTIISKTGRYNLTDKSKLTRVYFLLGKSYQRIEKADKAVEAYQDTLRLDPNHLPAKYNLEMIVLKGGGGDGAEPKQAKTPPKI